MLLLTLGLSAWCAPFCTSRAGTASCLCPADSQHASWALPGEALQREDAGQPCRGIQRERERERGGALCKCSQHTDMYRKRRDVLSHSPRQVA